MKEIGDRIKERMLGAHVFCPPNCVEIRQLKLCRNRTERIVSGPCTNRFPFSSLLSSKYIVLTQVNENAGQGGR